MNNGWLVVAVASLTLLVADTATAQTRVQNSGFRENRIVDDTLLKSGRWEVGVQSAGMWSSDSGSSDDGSVEASASTLYINPSIAGGYMILDNLQGRINAGYLSVSSTNNDVSIQNFGGFLGTGQVLYHIPFRLGTALYLGAGGGYFIGSTDRPGTAEGSTISNPTSGFAGQGSIGLLLQPGPMLLLRGGLRFDALIASETSSDASIMPNIDSTNLKMMGEFAVGLRF